MLCIIPYYTTIGTRWSSSSWFKSNSASFSYVIQSSSSLPSTAARQLPIQSHRTETIRYDWVGQTSLHKTRESASPRLSPHLFSRSFTAWTRPGRTNERIRTARPSKLCGVKAEPGVETPCDRRESAPGGIGGIPENQHGVRMLQEATNTSNATQARPMRLVWLQGSM